MVVVVVVCARERLSVMRVRFVLHEGVGPNFQGGRLGVLRDELSPCEPQVRAEKKQRHGFEIALVFSHKNNSKGLPRGLTLASTCLCVTSCARRPAPNPPVLGRYL